MVHKRYQKAIRERTVQLRSRRDGTASLHGWALPPDKAAAAMDYLSRLARATKQAGDPDTRFDDRDQRTLGQLRADIMVNLLTGVDPTTPASQGGAGAVEPAGRKWASKSCLGRYALVWAATGPSRTCLPPAGS